MTSHLPHTSSPNAAIFQGELRASHSLLGFEAPSTQGVWDSSLFHPCLMLPSVQNDDNPSEQNSRRPLPWDGQSLSTTASQTKCELGHSSTQIRGMGTHFKWIPHMGIHWHISTIQAFSLPRKGMWGLLNCKKYYKFFSAGRSNIL